MKPVEWSPMVSAPKDREIVARFGCKPYYVRWCANSSPEGGYWKFALERFNARVYDFPGGRRRRRFTGWRELSEYERRTREKMSGGCVDA